MTVKNIAGSVEPFSLRDASMTYKMTTYTFSILSIFCCQSPMSFPETLLSEFR